MGVAPVMLFPYETLRAQQKELFADAAQAIAEKKILLAHAPTGLGKTAAVLSPALEEALRADLTIFFLTSRHTQHAIVLETVAEICKRHGVLVPVATIVAKRNLCLQEHALSIYPHEFADYCKTLRKDGQCDYYANTRTKEGKSSQKAQALLEELKDAAPASAHHLKQICEKPRLCPYEIGTLHAKQSRLIICDYNYLFHPSIRDSFLGRTQHDLSKCIVIVDEAHNLPERLREMASDHLSTAVLERAMRECEKFHITEAQEILLSIRTFFSAEAASLPDDEKSVTEKQFTSALPAFKQAIGILKDAGETVLEKQQRSSIHSIAEFLHTWTGPDEGFTRVLSRREGRQVVYTLSYRCLDPAMLSQKLFGMVHSAILMSGTLSPTFFYRDILGLSSATEKSYQSPFPETNKLPLIVPQTTTRYPERSEENFRKIAMLLSLMTHAIPGNTACFFPSYILQRAIGRFLEELVQRPILYERSFASPEDKTLFLNRFKAHKEQGAILLGVAAANFAEGIDLPGDLLRAVIVVGLPLAKPDIETKALISYYEKKFSNGWDYGYVLPAFTKTLQSAGRCIRTETDRGALIFLDTRYALPQYRRLFPPEWNIKTTTSFVEELRSFYTIEREEQAFRKGRIM